MACDEATLRALLASSDPPSVVEECFHTKVTASPGGVVDDTPTAAVDAVDARDLTYSEFVKRYMARNVPVVVKGAARGWRAAREWATPDGGVNMAALAREFGASHVCAVDTSRQYDGVDGSSLAVSMTVAEYAAWWQGRNGGEGCASGGGRAGPLYYLKDWHLSAEYPGYQGYETPPYFADDWLNEWYQQGAPSSSSSSPSSSTSSATSDYRFVYAGPAGTWTPLHADVLRSFSWSANVAGRKRWWLVPPALTPLLYDRAGRRMAPHLLPPPPAATAQGDAATAAASEAAAAAYYAEFPHLQRAARLAVQVVQEPHDIIFVPSGWHHAVANVTDCVSINHNWLNGHNAAWVWRCLQEEYVAAAREIDDCRALCGSRAEFDGLVQRNVAANAGLDLHGLADLLAFVIRRALPAAAAGGPASAGAVGATGLLRLRAAAWVLRDVLAYLEGCGGSGDSARMGRTRVLLQQATAVLEQHGAAPWS